MNAANLPACVAISLYAAAELGLAAKSARGRKVPAPKQSENERAPSVYAKAVVGLKGRQ